MIGMIKKDLLLIKSNIKTFMVLFLMFILMTFKGVYNVAFILPLMFTMVFISTFSYDDYNKWYAYAITFPNGRKNIVLSKYITTIIIVTLTTLLSIVLSLVITYLTNGNIQSILSSLVGSIVGISVIVSIMYPFIFKYGVEKGRIAMFLGVFILSLIAGILFKLIDESILYSIIDFINNFGYIIIPITIILFLTISYNISNRVMMKKEF